MHAGLELRMVADAVGDRGQALTIIDTLRRFRCDAVAAVARLGARRWRRHMRLQVRHRCAHLPPPALSSSLPRARKLGLLASCAISRSPIAITPSSREVGFGLTRRWNFSG